jgi:long-chain acyl-CoA synthetase
MNEITIPAIIPTAVAGNLTNLIAERAWFEPERVVVSRPLGAGWQAVLQKIMKQRLELLQKD